MKTEDASKPKRYFSPNAIPWPPILLLLAIAGGVVLQMAHPLSWVSGSLEDLFTGFGMFFMVAAIAVDLFCFRIMRNHKTNIMPHRGADHLVTKGPYSISRNPIYVANVLLVCGLAIVLGNSWMFATAALMAIAIHHLAIKREEAHLELRFGKAWRDYRKKVRRWL